MMKQEQNLFVLGLGMIFGLFFLLPAIGFLIGVVVMLRKWAQTKKAVPLLLALLSFLGMLIFLLISMFFLLLAYSMADYGGFFGN